MRVRIRKSSGCNFYSSYWRLSMMIIFFRNNLRVPRIMIGRSRRSWRRWCMMARRASYRRWRSKGGIGSS